MPKSMNDPMSPGGSSSRASTYRRMMERVGTHPNRPVRRDLPA
jgi:hypothetical protein